MTKRIFIYSSFTLLFLLNSFIVKGQEELNYNKWSAQLNVQHQDMMVNFSFGQLGVYDQVLVRPVVSLDMQRTFLKKGNIKRRRLVSAQIGYYSNTYHERWLSLKVGMRAERQIMNNFYASFGIEIGATRTDPSDVQYALEDGKWVRTNNSAPAALDFLYGPRLDIGYRVLKGDHPIDILITNNLLIHENDIGGLPYYATGIGVRYGL